MKKAFALFGLMLAACSPAAPASETPAAAARAAPVGPSLPANPIFGAWRMSTATVAPWWDKKGAAPIADPAMAAIAFAADKSSGAPILACDKPAYTVSITEPRGLFEGNLPDAAASAKSLGFDIANDITSIAFSCASSANDISLDFPMIDHDTLMLGLNNMLYRFSRVK